jgi:GNAT superfamily N-acetyltransferase
MQTGPDFSERHVLRDGTRVTLRHIHPSDRGALREAFLRLSPESRYRRFFAMLTDLDDRTLDYLCKVDGRDHVALVAFIESPDMKEERGVGVVRFIRVPDEKHVADVAVTVADDIQHKGLGTLLLFTAMRAARERGITHFRGEVLSSNSAVIDMLKESGAECRSAGDGTMVFDLAIGEARPDNPMVRLLGLAARQLNVFLRKLLPP